MEGLSLGVQMNPSASACSQNPFATGPAKGPRGCGSLTSMGLCWGCSGVGVDLRRAHRPGHVLDLVSGC